MNPKKLIRWITVKDLYYQVLIGCGVHGIFWFQFNLLFISLFVVIIIFISKKTYNLILFVFCMIIIFFKYFGYISLFFSKYKIIPVHHSIHPLPNSFIFAITGFYLASIDILNKSKLYWKKICLFFGLFLSLIMRIKKYFFLEIIYIDIVGICLLFIFALLPFEKINNSFIKLFLQNITNFTGGVYYLHPEVGLIFRRFVNNIYSGNFIGCIDIYIISYIICFVGSNLFAKNKLKYLFN